MRFGKEPFRPNSGGRLPPSCCCCKLRVFIGLQAQTTGEVEEEQGSGASTGIHVHIACSSAVNSHNAARMPAQAEAQCPGQLPACCQSATTHIICDRLEATVPSALSGQLGHCSALYGSMAERQSSSWVTQGFH